MEKARGLSTPMRAREGKADRPLSRKRGRLTALTRRVFYRARPYPVDIPTRKGYDP